MGDNKSAIVVIGIGALIIGGVVLAVIMGKKPEPGGKGILSGIVTDGDIPLEGVTVTLFRGATGYATLTNIEGKYLIPNITIGTYQLSFQKGGFAFAIGNIPINEGENIVDVVMNPEADTGLEVEIRDSHGNRIAGRAA